MTARTHKDQGPPFLERRADLRLALDSEGLRDARVTTTRGVAFEGPASLHVTDPTDAELSAMFGAGGTPGALPAAPEVPWTPEREGRVRDLGARLTAGVAGASWSVNVVAFEQDIWVVDPIGELRQDTRRGCRQEVTIRRGGHPNARAVADWADAPGFELPPVRAFEWAFERSERKQAGLRRAAGGTTSAVFAPGVAGLVVHELAGHALEGDVAGLRPTWIQSHGLVSPPREVTVLDDPRRGRGAWALDDEGTPSREVVLVEAGKPAGLLLDLRAAARMGRPSTGHARRASCLDAVRPRMGCTFLAAGTDDPAEVVRETHTGVFIHRMSSGHTDPFEGRASFLVTEADVIENGAIGSPLEPFILELRGNEAWGSIDRIGHDLTFDTCVGSCVRDGQPLAVSVGAPTIRIGVVTVIS